MAYCNSCGAYIPDGQTVCLACGTDQNAAEEAAAAAASATQRAPGASGRFDSEFLRKQLEQQRARQRENSKKWAEAEAARRRRQQEQQEKRAESYVNSDPAARSAPDEDPAAAAQPNRAMAAISYLGILCFLPMLACPNDDFAMFHARQGLGLFLVGLGCNLLSTILGLNWLVTLLWIYLIYMGISAAAKGKRQPLPYIGGLFTKK